jgi:PAS domain S-box-containing protein
MLDKLKNFFFSKLSRSLGFQMFFVWALISMAHFLYEKLYETNEKYIDDLFSGVIVLFALSSIGIFNLLRVNHLLQIELKKSQELDELKLFCNSIPEIGFILNPDGAVIYVNRRWTDFTGLDPSEALGWKWRDIIHPEERDHVVSIWAAHTYKKTDFRTEHRVRDKDGKYSWFLAKARPIIGDDGKVLKWFGTLSNIQDYMEEKQTFSP